MTEADWQQGREPAFEIRARQGFFCQDVPVVGYSLEPIAIETAAVAEDRSIPQI